MSRYIRVLYRGKELTGRLVKFALRQNEAILHFGYMTGNREVNFNTGYGVGSFSDWRVHPDDLELLREDAVSEGKKVTPCGRSTGRPRKPRGPGKVHPKQLSFEAYLERKAGTE